MKLPPGAGYAIPKSAAAEFANSMHDFVDKQAWDSARLFGNETRIAEITDRQFHTMLMRAAMNKIRREVDKTCRKYSSQVRNNP